MSAESDSVPDRIDAIAIVGVGLLGGSIAAAVKARGLAKRIVGVGRNADRLQSARAVGLIDTATTSLTEATSQSQLIVFCTPVDQIACGLRAAASSCRSGTLMTDVGSVKASICREFAGAERGDITFIGSHPLAGSEKQGFEHADADLFDGCLCVVTPAASTRRDQLERLTEFWRGIGADVCEMSPEAHDQALAQTSHMPHVVASALAATLSAENRRFAATGFADTTRIAAGDPDLWAAILLANAESVLQRHDDFAGELAEFRDAIANRDAAALKNLLQSAKRNRDTLP